MNQCGCLCHQSGNLQGCSNCVYGIFCNGYTENSDDYVKKIKEDALLLSPYQKLCNDVLELQDQLMQITDNQKHDYDHCCDGIEKLFIRIERLENLVNELINKV